MGDYASGHKAIAECDICGFRYYLRRLRAIVTKNRITNIMACPECWNEDHPQNSLGSLRILDPQAIRNPRPDFAGYAASRALRIQAKGFTAKSALGTVTVTT